MADRFPAIEDLDAGETAVRTNRAGAEGSSFLERERAVLGDDASQFTTSGENIQAATVEDGDDDLLGGEFSSDNHPADAPPHTGQEISDFESSFPAVDTQNTNIGPSGTITGDAASYQPPIGGYTDYSAPVEEETEPVKIWREQRDTDIARRDAASVQKREETRSKAQADLDSFYENYNKKQDRARVQVREQAEKFVENIDNTAAGGTAWERIAKLADLHKAGPKAVDGSNSGRDRMRTLMLDLAKDKDAPGASGV